ncbi:hypothetical protein Tco_0718528 [Tanacetum coccineum]
MFLVEGRMDQVVVLEMRWLWDKKVVVFELLKIVDFLLNTFFFEKVKALGARGVVKGSSLGVVWMMLCGGIERARVVSRVVVMIVLLMLRGFRVEELALETILFGFRRDDMGDLICRFWSEEMVKSVG